MRTIRLTMAQALVRYLTMQKILIEGLEEPLFPGVYAIFGHGNVTCLGEALEAVKEEMPTWRGQNEQSMALAGMAFTKSKRRRQIMVATSSIGPGSTNLLTAAAAAHANRLPILLLSGDTFANRLPDPVLQQVENFHNPGMTVRDAFQSFTRYWDRITRPEQLIPSLPQAVATMLDPADCGPVLLHCRRIFRRKPSTIRKSFLKKRCIKFHVHVPTRTVLRKQQTFCDKPKNR